MVRMFYNTRTNCGIQRTDCFQPNPTRCQTKLRLTYKHKLPKLNALNTATFPQRPTTPLVESDAINHCRIRTARHIAEQDPSSTSGMKCQCVFQEVEWFYPSHPPTPRIFKTIVVCFREQTRCSHLTHLSGGPPKRGGPQFGPPPET